MSDEPPKVEQPKGEEGSAPLPRASLTAGIAPDEELPRLWQRSIAPYFDARPVDTDTPPRLPEIHQFSLGSILLAETRFSAQTFDRDRRWMRRYNDSDHLLLQLFVEGQNRIVNGTDEYLQQPGNVYAVNLTYELKALSTDVRVLTLALPRDLVRDALPHLIDARGAVFAPNSAAARVFGGYLLSLHESLGHATQDEAPLLTRATLALLESLTSHGDVASSVAQGAGFHSACRYIEAHLADPALGVAGICRYLRCSRATLYRLFAAQGGVQEYIRRRRLVACFEAIASPRQRHRRIYDIALDFGFTSPSHFSHAFRDHFGMTPRAARDAGLDAAFQPAPSGASAGTAEQAVEQMRLWAKTLAGRPR